MAHVRFAGWGENLVFMHESSKAQELTQLH